MTVLDNIGVCVADRIDHAFDIVGSKTVFEIGIGRVSCAKFGNVPLTSASEILF